MNVFQKIFKGHDGRFSRFHTLEDEFCGIGELPSVFPASWSWLQQRVTGKFRVLPWWPYRAISEVSKSLDGRYRVLEVGGGYSTLWLAQRCSAVHSIEEDAVWAAEIVARAQDFDLDNIEVCSGDLRAVFSEKWKEENWDVVVIDGPGERSDIFDEILRSGTRPSLIIYDDTDKVQNRAARKHSIPGYRRDTYRGFKPQTVHVCETTVFRRE